MRTNNKIRYWRCFIMIPFIVSLIYLTSCSNSNGTSIQNMLVEYTSQPVGMDVGIPRFTWDIESKERDIRQTSYQIIVSKEEGGINSKNGDSWDSGIIESDETVNVEYTGTKLESNTTYYWRVAATLSNGKTIWSSTQFFHTGFFNEQDWKASWITSINENLDNAPYLRKSFHTEKKIKQAIVYASAVGYYELYLNGERISDHVLDPGITDFKKTILYAAFDATNQMKTGENVLAGILGNGAKGMRRTEGRWTWWGVNKSLGKPMLLVQMMITYQDGSSEVIATDASWKTASSPITYNDIYGGEDYDARLEIPNWNKANFDDSSWGHSLIAEKPGGKLKAQLMPAIKVTKTIEPITVTNPQPGVYLYDLGQNIAGWWKIEVEGEAGQIVRVRAAETLSDSLFGEPLTEKSKINFTYLHFRNVWTDYTLKGGGTEIYEPRFFYSGFRYVEVTTNDKKNPKKLHLQGRVVRSSMEQTGIFESSDSLLNQIHRAGLWAQKGNLHGYPTDCPHREKGPYNGDGQVIAETSMHDFQMASFYTKWINDMRDSQEENGRIPNTSPPLVGGNGGGVAWGSAYIQIPWWMYHYYQDKRILEEHYDAMKKYMQYLQELGANDADPAEPHIIDFFDGYWFSLGEWCAPIEITGKNDCPVHAVVNTFYSYFNSLTLSNIAETIGNHKDREYFKTLSETIKENFNRKFLNPETGIYGTEEVFQTYQILPLIGNAVPEEFKQKVFQALIGDIKAHDNHLRTGILGTKYIWPVLVHANEHELAFKIATQRTYPSYGYWIDKGATTLFEQWNGNNSYNHQMFGSVAEYFYKFLAGIQSPMEGNTSVGYRYLQIEPHVPANLNFVKASVKTLVGVISTNWKKSGDQFELLVSIPANTTASLVLPTFGKSNITLKEGNKNIWKNNRYIAGARGIHHVKSSDNKLIIKSGSGDYKFTVN